MTVVFRVQDSEGRGPFRPGLSHIWLDHDRVSMPPTWMEEFGADVFERCGRPGEFFGSAVDRLESLEKWFTRIECQRLEALGFHVVSIHARVIAKSESQLVFGRGVPLNFGATRRRWHW